MYLAVNPVTNKVYVANWDSRQMTIVNGATNRTHKVAIAGESEAHSIVVNTKTNKIYVASDWESRDITVIDGTTSQTTAITTAGYVSDLALNPVTNTIYAANSYIGKLSVIDGFTNSVTAVAVGGYPVSIAVNPVTNNIYVANGDLCGGVTIIDGRTSRITEDQGWHSIARSDRKP